MWGAFCYALGGLVLGAVPLETAVIGFVTFWAAGAMLELLGAQVVRVGPRCPMCSGDRTLLTARRWRCRDCTFEVPAGSVGRNSKTTI